MYAEAIADQIVGVDEAAESLEAQIHEWIEAQASKPPACDFCGVKPHHLNTLIKSSISNAYVCCVCVTDLGLQVDEIEYTLNTASPSSYEH